MKLSREERALFFEWLREREETLPEPLRRPVSEMLSKLQASGHSVKAMDRYGRQLAMLMGMIPSSERRRLHSGRPLGGRSGRRRRKTAAAGATSTPSEPQDAVEATPSESRCDDALAQLEANDTREAVEPGQGGAEPSAERSGRVSGRTSREENLKLLTPEKRAAIAAESAAFAVRAQLGGGADPALESEPEALMNADVVCVEEDFDTVEAVLPSDAGQETVVKTLVDPRMRYEFAVTVTRLQLNVEKKVLVTKDGKRRIISGDVQKYGPKGFAVTWQALATLAVMVGQFAMPLNRLGTMLSTATKKFTATSLGRMLHYVAERFAPIYLTLMEQLADSDILAGDDTSCRVLEVASYYARNREGQADPKEEPPWRGFGTTGEANRSYLKHLEAKAALLQRRDEGEREARTTPVKEPPLKVLIGRELDFESKRKDGDGPKQALNTTVVTGRTEAHEPSSQVVFYRSHLGSLGDLLTMLLSRRRPSKRKLIVQADLSTTNLVTDPTLTSRFDIELVGCSAHARRPFAQYADQDPRKTAVVLSIFGVLAVHEEALDYHGRNRENSMAVRGVDSLKMWERLKRTCTALLERWTKATPLGAAARYILKHYERLTAYLRDPRLQATNNLRERLLRTEKLIEKSSMFRKSIEGRVVLDIVRTILQTAVAAGAAPHEYLVDVMKASPEDVQARPEHYTPAAWVKRRLLAEEPASRPPAETPSAAA